MCCITTNFFGVVEPELAENRVGTFRNYFRMSRNQFDYILRSIADDIYKAETTIVPISAEERLMVTLRYLATGQSMTSLHYEWRLAVATISHIIIEVCEAILNNLKSRWLNTPVTMAEWVNVAEGFKRWNYPNCLGAIDGKHVAMNKPWHAGSEFHNYKDFESLILLAVCDANYRFIYVDCGAEGRNSDGGVFRASRLYDRIENGTMGLPGPSIPDGGVEPLPYVIVGDEAFPLKTYLMRPYAKLRTRAVPPDEDVHNNRLSRARRLIENSFGILANTWRILLKRIDLEPHKTRQIVLTTCILHNILRENRQPPAGAALDRILVDDAEGFGGVQERAVRGGNAAMTIRNKFKRYVNTHPILF